MIRKHRTDTLLAIAVAAAVVVGWLLIVAVFSREHWDRNDFWFDSDLNRIAMTLTGGRDIPPLHTNVHPAFALYFNPPLKLLVGLTPFNKLLVLFSLVTAAWVGGLFVLLRMVGVRRLDAAVFTALGATSAAALFFSTIPETFPVGALVIVGLLLLVAIEQRRPLPVGAHIVAGAFAMGVTVTHGLISVFSAMRTPGRRAAVIVGGAVAGLLVLSLAQNLLFPTSQFVLDPRAPKGGKFTEDAYVLSKYSGGPLWQANAMLVSPVVAPELKVRDKPLTIEKMMTFEKSAPGSGSALGRIAVIAWLGLLGTGVWAFFAKRPTWGAFRMVLGLTLAAQVFIHLFYGQELFPYSLHFLPLLVVMAAMGTLTRLRPVVLGLASVVVVAGLVNNLYVLGKAHELWRQLDSAYRAAVGQH